MGALRDGPLCLHQNLLNYLVSQFILDTPKKQKTKQTKELVRNGLVVKPPIFKRRRRNSSPVRCYDP